LPSPFLTGGLKQSLTTNHEVFAQILSFQNAVYIARSERIFI